MVTLFVIEGVLHNRRYTVGGMFSNRRYALECEVYSAVEGNKNGHVLHV